MTDHFFNRNHNGSKVGYWGGTALFYLFYLMDLPSQDFNTAIARGDNVPVDANYVLSGSTSVSYGNAARCFTLDGQNKRGGCNSGAVDEFFKQYLPPRFYQGPAETGLGQELHRLPCQVLATRSKMALASYFAGR